MLVHTVYFWIKPDTSDEKRTAFRAHLEKVAAIEHVSHGWVGTPAATEKRPVIEDSYDFGLCTVFEDLAAHDAYQIHDVHQSLLKEFSPYFDRVQVFDAD